MPEKEIFHWTFNKDIKILIQTMSEKELTNLMEIVYWFPVENYHFIFIIIDEIMRKDKIKILNEKRQNIRKRRINNY